MVAVWSVERMARTGGRHCLRVTALDARPQQHETEGGGNDAGDDEDGQLDGSARAGRDRAEQPQGAGGYRQGEREGRESHGLVAHHGLAAANAEREAPVGGGVADRRKQQRYGVGGRGRQAAPQHAVEHHVGQRAGHSDAQETQHCAVAAQAVEPQAPDAAQVVPGGAPDVHPRVGVVDPVHRDLVDAHAGALRGHQQLGVEEPGLVRHQRQQLPCRIGAEGLEAALRVPEAGPQDAPQQQVVGARDELAFGAARDARTR